MRPSSRILQYLKKLEAMPPHTHTLPCFSCTGLTGTCHGGPRDFSQDFSSLRRPQQTAPSSYPLTHVPYGTLQQHNRPSKVAHPQILANQIAGNKNPQTPPPLPLRRTATTHGSMMPKMSMVPHSHSQYYPPMCEQLQHPQAAPIRPGTNFVHLPWTILLIQKEMLTGNMKAIELFCTYLDQKISIKV